MVRKRSVLLRAVFPSRRFARMEVNIPGAIHVFGQPYYSFKSEVESVN